MRFVRVAACTAATALLSLAAGTGSASAATSDKGLLYSSTANTGVLQLELRLPTQLLTVPNPAVLTLLGTAAQAYHGNGSADVATARSYLAGGNLVTGSAVSGLLSPLSRIVTSTLAAPGLHSATALAVPSNPLGLNLHVADQTAAVNAVSRLTTSDGKLATASLGSLSTLGLGSALTTSLATLNGALATVTTQSAALTTALTTLPALPSVSLPNPLTGVITGVPATISTPAVSGATLAATVADLPTLVKGITDKLANGALVSVGAVTTQQSLAPGVSNLVSTAGTNTGDISLLGGLLTVHATKAAVAATAGLTAQAAKATASATLISVTLSDDLTNLLSVVASDKGVTAKLLDGTLLGTALDESLEPVVNTVNAALNTVLTAVTGLVSDLNGGAKLITQGTVSKSISADGHRAEAHAIPAQLSLGLPIAPNLLTLSLGQADIVSALSVAPPTVVTPPTTLPRTGASEGAAAVALLLVFVAGGTVLVRRRSHSGS